MVISEKITKDFLHLCFSVSNFLKRGLKSQSILVFPEYPSRNSTLYKLGNLLGYTITNKPSKRNSALVYWENKTHRTEQNKLDQLQKKYIINKGSVNISKVFVDATHLSVFGYNTMVNPTSHTGKMVQKSDTNAKHDGQLIEGPIDTPLSGSIYQILVDNTVNQDLIVDMRVPYIGEVTDFIYLKYRPIQERFENTTIKTELKKTDEHLSNTEIKQIEDFCKKSNLDFGELDVLRDNTSGKIYIVDVNNTPFGPPANIEKQDGKKALKRIAYYFEKNFINKN